MGPNEWRQNPASTRQGESCDITAWCITAVMQSCASQSIFALGDPGKWDKIRWCTTAVMQSCTSQSVVCFRRPRRVGAKHLHQPGGSHAPHAAAEPCHGGQGGGVPHHPVLQRWQKPQARPMCLCWGQMGHDWFCPVCS